LKDIVWMTVAVSDGRHSQRFTDIRKEIYGTDFPASTLLTAACFAVPGDHGGDHTDSRRRGITGQSGAMLDQADAVLRTAAVMLIFDDYTEGLENLGKRIRPLIKRKSAVLAGIQAVE
jgi:hypothetical protein